MFNRLQKFKGIGNDSAFLWGPRQVGKSTLLKTLFPDSLRYDLLLTSEFIRLSKNPALMREEILADPQNQKKPVLVDEIQKIPILLDEVHWLIENHGIQFILCGSSARKLKKAGTNLLGGRALRYELFPLVFPEINNFDLETGLNHGLLPRHYLAIHIKKRQDAYVNDYLKEEIFAESLVRNIQTFSEFLEKAAFSNGEFLVYKNIATDCGVSAITIKEYFQILVDTLLGDYLPAYRKKAKRRTLVSPKFYFFDCGIVNCLLHRGKVMPKTEIFGKVFEHFIYQELRAHSHYSELDYPLSYWRTTSQFEVDFILGDAEVAIEIKGVEEVQTKHLKGLKAFLEEFSPRRAFVVSLDKRPRKMGPIEILPWRIFLEKLWSGEII